MLPDNDQQRIDLTIARSLGTLFLDIDGSADERFATLPEHAEHLRLALLAHGHLSQREERQTDTEVPPTPPVEMSLANRRRATRDAERAARRERILSGQPQDRMVQRQQRREPTLRPQEVERQNGTGLIEPPSQTKQQGKQMGM
ncbi:MAG: hypothetical protein AUG49_01340 [Catenulispora sp. 13_1_20CM_3_70_7]|nr:MAG: hypothetical protein AUG49_01340 [Catenulispora sp. 13_1_20CM_3_70_7]